MSPRLPKIEAAPTTRELAEARFVSYGLAPETVYQTLGVTTHDDAREVDPRYANAPCLHIPYRNPITGGSLITWPQHPPFARIRYLTEFPRAKELGDSRKALPKYLQAAGTVNGLYFPPNFIGWAGEFADTGRKLFVTEGEFKAARACQDGYTTVAIGGVDLWRSKAKAGYDDLLPEFDFFKLIGREVFIVFDSDWQENPNIGRNLNLLGAALRDRGAFPKAVLLRGAGDAKVGLDDFLESEGREAFDELVDEAVPLRSLAPLFALNEEAAFIRDPGFVAFTSGQKSKPADMAYRYTNPILDRQIGVGTVFKKEVKLGLAWLDWPLRRTVERVSYVPGQSERVLKEDGVLVWNDWPGWGLAPAKGDAKPFLALLDHVMVGAEKAHRDWLLRWFAYPLQRPGTKLLSSVMLHSRIQGNGKSLLGETFEPIYGKNYGRIRQTDIDNRFTAWAANKQFIQGDEVSSTRDKRHEENFFKNLITQRKVTIDRKNLQPYDVPDRINYFWTSNHADPLFLSDEDRRFFVHQVTAPQHPPEFGPRYVAWLADGGAAALFDYLLKIDLGDFSPTAPPPVTAAKLEMIEHGRSDLGRWVRDLIADPDGMLRIGEVVRRRDLFTAEELMNHYRHTRSDSRMTESAVGRALAEAGVPAVLGRQLRGTPAVGKPRFYVIRNRDKWTKPSLTVDAVLAYLKKEWDK